MDKQSLEFHIRSDDYFGTLATTLDLLRQRIEGCETKTTDDLLARLRDELLYLQHKYKIVNRE